MIAITGGTGFLGKHVTAALRARGIKDILPVGRKDADLVMQGASHDFMLWHKPEAVIHLAASVGGIGANREKPATFWLENTMMGANVLDACSMAGVKKLVMVGTTCSYPKSPKTIPFVEDELFDGYPEETNAPYGVAKRSLLVAAQAYRRQLGLNVVTVIPTNLYGPFDCIEPSRSHVIPAVMRSMIEAKRRKVDSITMWGTGKATRDFLYAGDAAQGVVDALEKLDSPEPVNLGSGKEISMADLALKIKEITDFKGDILWDTEKPDGQPRRVMDSSRAKEWLGWQAETPFDVGLQNTYEWMKGAL